ncbi:hypothetical protein MTO96_013187 [Rhipicephalus appendiculatus]
MSYRAQRVPSKRSFVRGHATMEWDPLMHALAFGLIKTTELENFHIRTPHEFGNKRDMSKVAVMRPRMAAGGPASDL